MFRVRNRVGGTPTQIGQEVLIDGWKSGFVEAFDGTHVYVSDDDGREHYVPLSRVECNNYWDE